MKLKLYNKFYFSRQFPFAKFLSLFLKKMGNLCPKKLLNKIQQLRNRVGISKGYGCDYTNQELNPIQKYKEERIEQRKKRKAMQISDSTQTKSMSQTYDNILNSSFSFLENKGKLWNEILKLQEDRFQSPHYKLKKKNEQILLTKMSKYYGD